MFSTKNLLSPGALLGHFTTLVQSVLVFTIPTILPLRFLFFFLVPIGASEIMLLLGAYGFAKRKKGTFVLFVVAGMIIASTMFQLFFFRK